MVRLTIPALHSFRDLVLSAVNAAIDAAGGSPSTEARDQIVSALSEAFNNVVIHAYRGVMGGTVDVTVEAWGPAGTRSVDVTCDAGVEVRLVDRGHSFDPLEVPSYEAPRFEDAEDLDALDLDRLPEGGMGLFIIRSFMDDVSYQRGGGGKPNVLTLRKSWAHDEAAEIASPAVGATQPLAVDAAQRLAVDAAQRLAVDAAQRSGATPTPSSKKESSRSGWRMRSVAVPSYDQSTAGSLKRK